MDLHEEEKSAAAEWSAREATRLRVELLAAEAEIERLRRWESAFQEHVRTRVAQARREAFEEAARYVESLGVFPGVASGIRSLAPSWLTPPERTPHVADASND